jgi:hypothetical protein
MSSPKAYCPKCKREVDCLVERGSLYCPHCRYKFEQFDPDAKPEIRTAKEDLLEAFLKSLRAIFIVLVIFVGVILVFLAFAYAACSAMRI